MSEAERQVEVAITLMRMALALLDAAGEGIAAARLQHAIDTVRPDPMPDNPEGWLDDRTN